MSDIEELTDPSTAPRAGFPACPTPAQTDWASLLMGLFLLVNALGLVGIAPVLALLGLSAISTLGEGDALTLLMLAAGTFALGLLLTLGAYLNARKFFNRSEPRFGLQGLTPGILLVTLFTAWVISLALGRGLSASPTFSLFLLPLVNVAAILLPITIVLVITLKGLPMPSPRRALSIFGVSAALAPALSIFFELFAFIGFGLLFVLYASSTPGLEVPFWSLMDELQSETGSMDFIAQQATTLLLSPGAAILLLGLLALAVPVIEEVFKVFLLWFYAGRMPSPVEGFVAGALCGAAFALAENIGFASAGAEDWLLNILTRAAAVLPHTFNSGLVGWGLVAAWQKRSYLRLGLAYVAAVLVHGAWNALSVTLALNAISGVAAGVSPLIETPLPAAITWGLLILGIFLGLLIANRQMRKQAAREAAGM